MIETLVEAVRARLPVGRPGVVGLAGSVAVGKTTLAHQIAAALGAAVEVVGTDGFLLPNDVLNRRGLLDRKGFPETFDAAGVAHFVAAVRGGTDPLSVPTYDHGTYDVGTSRLVHPAPRVVLLEGINALAQPELLDVGVYLDADEPNVIDWYLSRFLVLRDAARTDPTSFYRRFLHLSDAETIGTARGVWEAVNGPNLREHIAPQRSVAEIVVMKRADHSIAELKISAER